MKTRLALLLLALAASLAADASAQCFEAFLRPAGLSGYDRFGVSLALDGEGLFVASTRFESGGPTAPRGAVFRYERDAAGVWSEREVLVPPPGAVGSTDFGFALARDGLELAVGAPRDSSAALDAGKVHVFRAATPGGPWSQAQELTAAPMYAQLGGAVALQGDVLVAGAPVENVGAALFLGAVYVFVRDSTTGQFAFTQRLPFPGPGGIAFFGSTLALDGDFLSVSAPGFHGDDGRVYLYRRDPVTGAFVDHTVLSPANPGSNARFGEALAMKGGWLLTSRRDTPAGGARGRAVLFRYDAVGDTWTLVDEVVGPARGHQYIFGQSLAFDGVRAVMGASGGPLAFEYELDAAAGTLRYLRLHAWTGSVAYSPGAAGAPTVAIDAGTVVLGSSDHSSNRGAVNVFGDVRCRPLGTRFCAGDVVANSSGLEAQIDAFGDDALAAGLFSLRAFFVPTDELGYFLGSRAPGVIAQPGGSAGVLCLSGNVVRFRFQATESSFMGFFARSLDLASLPTFPPSAVLPGETWYFQAWFRDGASSNFTDGVAVTFN